MSNRSHDAPPPEPGSVTPPPLPVDAASAAGAKSKAPKLSPPKITPRSPAEVLEPTRAPRRPKGRNPRREARRLGPAFRALNAILTLSAVLLVAGFGGTMLFDREVDKAGPLKAVKTVVVREREGARDIAQRLEADGVINSQHVFVAHYVLRYVGTWFGGKPLQLKAGEYQFDAEQSIRSVAEEIGKGRAVLVNITIPEGLTSHQIVERLKADQSLGGTITTTPPEGSLMPDTYKVPRGMSRQAVIDLMQAEWTKFVEKAWEGREADLPVKTAEEAVILASIVEKETGRRDEREKVAAVFVNRLRQGMRLQSDPTILYGLMGGQTQWGKPISKVDIQSRTAHNTYQIAALPPSPICNPGKASLLATLKPAQTKDLFFVADGNGGHVFSETLKDHNSAVGVWRKVEKDIRTKQQEAQQLKAGAKAGPPASAAGAPAQPAAPAAPAAAPVVINTPAVDAPAAAAAKSSPPPRPDEIGADCCKGAVTSPSDPGTARCFSPYRVGAHTPIRTGSTLFGLASPLHTREHCPWNRRNGAWRKRRVGSTSGRPRS